MIVGSYCDSQEKPPPPQFIHSDSINGFLHNVLNVVKAHPLFIFLGILIS